MISIVAVIVTVSTFLTKKSSDFKSGKNYVVPTALNHGIDSLKLMIG
jgi:hypothetical protein